MKIQPEIVVLLAHIFLTLLYTFFLLTGKSHLRKEHLLPLCLIPIFGPLTALVVELMILFGKQGKQSPDLENLALEDEILWATLRSFEEKSDLVPLEEAVLIDEVKVRRKLMLETLYFDPFKYLDVLNIAKYNEDIETSHYATTTIARAQKDFQIAIQKYAAELNNRPDDLMVINPYIELLGKYIQSGLLQEVLLKDLRVVYSKLLDRKLDIVKHDKSALIEKLRNAIELKKYASAFDSGKLLKDCWPEDEQTWIELLRICVASGDHIGLKETIEEIQRKDIAWTEHGREEVGPWLRSVPQ